MGAFFTNFQVRNTPTKSVCDALAKHTASRAYVSPESGGWVTVFAEATEDQNDKTLREIGGTLSKVLQAEVLAFLVHDSDIAAYWFYRGGQLVDEFDSAPDYFGKDGDDKTRARVRGNTDVLMPLCIPGTPRDQLDAVLHPPDGYPTFAEEIVTELAKLLGIDETRATWGFKYFDEEESDTLPDAAEFEPVGEGLERKFPAEEDTEAGGPPIPLPDTYSMAIGMLTQLWSEQQQKNVRQFSAMLKQDTSALLKQMQEGFDKSARDLLKKSCLPNRPTIEELKAARDQGAEALAALVAKRTPDQMTEVGIGAAVYGLEPFLSALLKKGLNPNAPNPAGRTTLNAAEQHGKDSAVYRLVKAATGP